MLKSLLKNMARMNRNMQPIQSPIKSFFEIAYIQKFQHGVSWRNCKRENFNFPFTFKNDEYEIYKRKLYNSS